MTRSELLKFALAQALRRVRLGAKRLALPEDERNQIAGQAVEELRRYGGWQALDEEAPIRHPAPGSGESDGDRREEWKGGR